mmetsp:Transcript_826/g.1327  ORF Transcript_826/g.1327 Transcript_826/m.1327 type:complete len:81 (+) Transcript_826:16-258(+)
MHKMMCLNMKDRICFPVRGFLQSSFGKLLKDKEVKQNTAWSYAFHVVGGILKRACMFNLCNLSFLIVKNIADDLPSVSLA